ncbi:uncharacterized protein LOC127709475 [Mytilus californianus]|uniref:uncharacterized protein LOC127709475 n=1 Tax=Mytilus californianus TaxID=6549 RepID=UPI00224745EB|nr:uncharacterized protein LOC127709475 [Mytilus californianus]
MCNLTGKMSFRFSVFFILGIIEVADLISDWLFYVEMSKQEKGIVFGPIDKMFLHAILAFCCIGIVTFIVEMVYNKLEILNDDNSCCIDFVYVFTFVLWCEELPQIGMSAYIASCREEGTSLIQLIKASFLIGGCILRIIIVVVRICSRRREDSTNCFILVFSFILIIGSILAFILALSVFVFSTIQHDDWSFKFQQSTKLQTSGGDPSRFFGSAGIYINVTELHKGSAQSNVNKSTWLKMANLTFLMNKSSQLQKIKFHRKENTTILIQTFLPMKDSADFQKAEDECYKETGELLFRQVNESECLNVINSTDVMEIWIHFMFLPQTRYRLMGDVQYNTCHVTSKDCSENVKTCTKVNLKYFSAVSGENYQYHLKPVKTNSLFEFYTSDKLTPTKEAWKTGFARCESSGFEAPNLDNSIEVKCLS